VFLISCSGTKDEKSFASYKSTVRNWIVKRATMCPNPNFLAWREFTSIDDPSSFFCDAYTTKLKELPTSVSLPTPWSAYYWSIKSGGLSYRYSPFNQTYHPTWKSYVNSYHQPADHNQFYNTSDWDTLVNKMYSPSEKYDLLVGDLDYTLTNKMKEEGKYMSKDSDGDVPGWMGKCHGWTPASINEKRPVIAVNLTAADGKTVITFYPEDIRALATGYWAEAKYETKFLGSRCEYSDFSTIPSDNETGLWDDYSCFTVNPATLVIVLANQLGVRKKQLIYDPDSNGQIWNQPVYGYSLSFFNPVTQESGAYNQSRIDMATLKNSTNSSKILDLVNRKASSKAASVIGVTMQVNFVFENPPIFGNKTKPDNVDSREYTFYLELDVNENIVGGEWTENSHPIFIWNPAEGKKINGYGDETVKTFNGTVAELQKLTEYAKEVSSENTVLGAIMKYLVEVSSKTAEAVESFTYLE